MSDENTVAKDDEEGIQNAPSESPAEIESNAEGLVDDRLESLADLELPEQRIATLEADLAEAKAQILRALADAENTRKRSEREKADARAYAIEKFAGDLLSVSDNLSRALTALPDSDRAGLSEAGRNLLGGIEMTEKELHAVLARNGVTAIDAVPGATFDPNLHQAVSQIPSDQPSGTIAQTFQSGWRIADRTLRAAMVAVSAGPAN